ncbi:MAG TPA: ATP-binding cassette domain-containing protein, partial [Ramlibacter sp.]|nr:ATP-binding cassette domain-containing protein [Ramlibacter sp.]
MTGGSNGARLLEVDDLTVKFKIPEGEVCAVNGLSFALERGQTFGIVGESGSGKSQSMLALMGLLAANGRATGSARFQGQELLGLAEPQINRIRGNHIAMI